MPLSVTPSLFRALQGGCVLAALSALVACGSAQAEFTTATAAPPPAPTPVQTVAAPETGDAVLEGDRIKVARNILYEVDKDAILPESFGLLDAVAGVLNGHPEITMLIVEGHTDSQGDFNHNKKLSERRSEAVVRYLAGKGVKTPMQAPGYGATAPVCMSDDEGCRGRNRRVEFKVKRAP